MVKLTKKLFLATLLAFVISVLVAPQVFAQAQYPEPKGHVNDFANILPDDFEQKLEATLRDYEAKTTNEIAVVTVSSLEGLSVEGYTIGLAEKWKVGKKGKDNGVILLVAPNERKVRIEVGYGLEPVLTDAKARRIIEEMTPFFKNGDYAQGLEVGVKRITDTIGYLTLEEKEAQKREKEAQDKAAMATFGRIMLYIGIFVALVIIFVVAWKKISAWKREKKRRQLLRETLKAEIPKVHKIKDALVGNLRKRKPEFLKKYLPRHHKMMEAAVSNAETFSQKCESLLGEAAEILEKEPDAAKEKLEQAEGLVDKMNSLQLELNEFDLLPKKISLGLKEPKDGLDVYTLLIEEARHELAALKTEAPSEVWSELEAGLGRTKALKEEIRNLLDETENLNSSTVQRFGEAEKKLERAKKLSRMLRKIIEAPKEKRQEFHEAKKKAVLLKRDLRDKTVKAEHKSKESDAGQEPKRLLVEAQTKQKEAEKLEGNDPTNWIVIVALFAAAIALADKAYGKAESNIDAARRRREDDSWHSSHSYGSSYGSSGGGFGGFGGGSFGGGGASGSW